MKLNNEMSENERYELYDMLAEILGEESKTTGKDYNELLGTIYDALDLNKGKNKKKSAKPMTTRQWANAEIDKCISRSGNDANNVEFYERIRTAFNAIEGSPHIFTVLGILNKLIMHVPLNPIEDTDDNWTLVGETDDGTEIYQCTQYPSLFKDVFLNRVMRYDDTARVVTYVGSHEAETISLERKLVNQLFPITMPYMPKNKPYKVYCDGFSYDEKNEDWPCDTIFIRYVITPDDKKEDIMRYFTGVGSKNEREITESEYYRMETDYMMASGRIKEADLR